jgi:hypothetical protein
MQAQTAGILYGKYAISPNSLTVWAAFSTVLVQAAIKAGTNYPDAYIEAFDNKYAEKVRSLANTDWSNPQEKQLAASQLLEILAEAKIPITKQELLKIMDEVRTHPQELQQSFLNIYHAYKKFQIDVM